MSDPANTVSEKEPGMPAPPPESATPPSQDEIKEGEPVKRKREYKDFGHEQEKATRA